MEDSESDQRVMDIVRIFLAASKRGDHAVLVLESRKEQVTTKYRTVEGKAGAPASTSTSTTKKKMNPARARRSKLRLEQFLAKKEKEKLEMQLTGNQAAASKKLILDLAKEDQVGTGILNPIPQVDGEAVEEDQVMYSFISMYAEEDILYTLEEIFPQREVICSLESRVRVEPLSAEHLCTIAVKVIDKGRSLSWPKMEADQAVVFQEIKKL